MLYLIIPPALIVLSLAGIIIFLMKKASSVARIEDQSFRGEADGGFFGKFKGRKEGRGEGQKNDQKTLLFLEKIILKFKLLFLKLENKLSGWSESIRQRRKSRNADNLSAAGDKRENIVMAEEEGFGRIYRREQNENRIEIKTERVLEKEAGGTKIADEKLEPQKNLMEKKDLFEKIMIERIASNPKDIEAYERLGEYYLEIENWNYAKECFKQVIKLNPGNAGAKAKMRGLERLLGR